MSRICNELWDEIKEQTELITGNKVTKYSKDSMKIRFKTNDDLPCVVVINSVFKEDNEYYPQVLLHD